MLLQRIPSLSGWSGSLRELDNARREFERMFHGLGATTGPRTAGVFPAINVSEDADAIYVRAELPGIKVDDLNLAIEKDTLTISGERQLSSGEESVSYHRRELEWGAFRRSMTLPTRVEADAIKARYVDGILTVTLPKAAEVRPRQITIQASA